MHKRLIGMIGLGVFCGAAAHAQTSVTIYGIADMGLVMEGGSPGGNLTKLSSGVASPSRLGFRGNEILGGGYSAKFVLESWVAMDTGATVGNLFGRQAYVGIDGPSGSLTLGRQYTPYMNVNLVSDPFVTTFAGGELNLVATQLRMNNAVKYATPVFNGFSAEIAYAFGEVAGSLSASRQYGGVIAFNNGPLKVRLGFNSRNSGTSEATVLGNGNNTALAASYDFGPFKLQGQYGIDKGYNSAPLFAPNPYKTALAPTPSTNSRDYVIGATVPVGNDRFLISYVRKDDKTSFNQDARQVGVGYVHPLSKRTDLYASYARISNKNGAGYTVGNGSEPGSGNRALDLGMRFSF